MEIGKSIKANLSHIPVTSAVQGVPQTSDVAAVSTSHDLDSVTIQHHNTEESPVGFDAVNYYYSPALQLAAKLARPLTAFVFS